MKNFLILPVILPAILLLAACASGDGKMSDAQQWRVQDNTITVVEHDNGQLTAVPPTCPAPGAVEHDTLMNDPLPQLGCSTAGNLARMIVDPGDLVRGELQGDRAAGHAGDGTIGAAAVQRYHEGKVYAPVDPSGSSGSSSSSGN